MFYFKEFVDTLPILLYGMTGVFIVIFIIALAVKLSCWVFPQDKD